MPRSRRESLTERQQAMRLRQLAARRRQDRRCKIDPQRVMALASMAFTVRDIARDLSCSEDTLYTDYRETIKLGRLRGGIVVRKVIYQRMLAGDNRAIRHLHRSLNQEEYELGTGRKKERKPQNRPSPRPLNLRAESKKALRMYKKLTRLIQQSAKNDKTNVGPDEEAED